MNKKFIVSIGVVIIVILGTYLFINQTIFNKEQADVDISDWKSYTNPITKYQIQYPPYWNAKEEWKALGESNEGIEVSFRDDSGLNSSSLSIFSSPGTLGRGWFCWSLFGEEKSLVDGFDATRITYVPFKDATPEMPCTDDPTSSSMRFIRVFFEDPNSIFPGFNEKIFYDLWFIVDESDLVLVDTIISTMLVNRF